jgi:hypothetical protein
VVLIQRVRCLDCGAAFSVQPSFIIRYKRYETDAVEKLMTLLFITEASYRMAGISQSYLAFLGSVGRHGVRLPGGSRTSESILRRPCMMATALRHLL